MNCNVVVIVLAAVCLAVVLSSQRICNVTEDCRPDECCVPHFSGLDNVCREHGDEPGDVCGGAYFCSSCGRGLECVPVVSETEEDSFFGLFDACPLPANGTCQFVFAPVNDTLELPSIEL